MAYMDGLGLSPQQKAWKLTVHYRTQLGDDANLGKEMINVQQKVPAASFAKLPGYTSYLPIYIQTQNVHMMRMKLVFPLPHK